MSLKVHGSAKDSLDLLHSQIGSTLSPASAPSRKGRGVGLVPTSVARLQAVARAGHALRRHKRNRSAA